MSPQHLCVCETSIDRALLGEDQDLLEWSTLSKLIDNLVMEGPSEMGIVRFGRQVMSKTEVELLMYHKIGDSLVELQNRLPTSDDGATACSLVMHSGQFVFDYGPDALALELERISSPEELSRAWRLIVPPYYIARSGLGPMDAELRPSIGALTMTESPLVGASGHPEVVVTTLYVSDWL